MYSELQNNRDKMIALFKQNGVESAFVFGSAAKGEINPKSDIDFVIRFSKNLDIETYANNYFNLLHALQDLFKRDVDLIAEETIKNPYFAASVNSGKVQLL